jgi:hypothetical protein
VTLPNSTPARSATAWRVKPEKPRSARTAIAASTIFPRVAAPVRLGRMVRFAAMMRSSSGAPGCGRSPSLGDDRPDPPYFGELTKIW